MPAPSYARPRPRAKVNLAQDDNDVARAIEAPYMVPPLPFISLISPAHPLIYYTNIYPTSHFLRFTIPFLTVYTRATSHNQGLQQPSQYSTPASPSDSSYPDSNRTIYTTTTIFASFVKSPSHSPVTRDPSWFKQVVKSQGLKDPYCQNN